MRRGERRHSGFGRDVLRSAGREDIMLLARITPHHSIQEDKLTKQPHSTQPEAKTDNIQRDTTRSNSSISIGIGAGMVPKTSFFRIWIWIWIRAWVEGTE